MNHDPWPIGMPHGNLHGIVQQTHPQPLPLYKAGVGLIQSDSITFTFYEKAPLLFGEAIRRGETLAIKAYLTQKKASNT